ncbi:hypothetical protein GCM10011519_07450 [Marmoricola endophyticus]|uniref:DUF2383 domain-containing protein n=1 Tax=Marmoricola endophyticus TaxID=2040280 RepID=A0A917F0K5_9ACTN|nr:PA2169 family four-helix-bundle protein [Marmoricola endophyticus]GGF36428.1 hypothetical protein GCM10011519_07450 [Marmoricola endophyticus]
MSDDAKAAKQLVETLKDGERGLSDAAEKLRGDGHAEWAATLQHLSSQRAGFWREIVGLGHDYGDDVEESGSAAAALHRGWISLKDALTSDDPSAVLKAAVTGEDHAVSTYEDAVGMDLSAGFREVVVRQQAAVNAAREEVRDLESAG